MHGKGVWRGLSLVILASLSPCHAAMAYLHRPQSSLALLLLAHILLFAHLIDGIEGHGYDLIDHPIERREDLSPIEFMESYHDLQRPVLMSFSAFADDDDDFTRATRATFDAASPSGDAPDGGAMGFQHQLRSIMAGWHGTHRSIGVTGITGRAGRAGRTRRTRRTRRTGGAGGTEGTGAEGAGEANGGGAGTGTGRGAESSAGEAPSTLSADSSTVAVAAAASASASASTAAAAAMPAAIEVPSLPIINSCSSERAAQNRCSEGTAVVSLPHFFEGSIKEMFRKRGTGPPALGPAEDIGAAATAQSVGDGGGGDVTRGETPVAHVGTGGAIGGSVGGTPFSSSRRSENRTIFQELRGAKARGLWQHVDLDVELVWFYNLLRRQTRRGAVPPASFKRHPSPPRPPVSFPPSTHLPPTCDSTHPSSPMLPPSSPPPPPPASGSMDFLSLGVASSGADFHRHGRAFAWLLHGEKRWFLMSPDVSIAAASRLWAFCEARADNSSRAFLVRLGQRMCPDNEQWAECQAGAAVAMQRGLRQADRLRAAALSACLTDDADAAVRGAGIARLPLMTCTQRAGDLLYIPPGYFHATVNHGDTVGLSQVATNENPGCMAPPSSEGGGAAGAPSPQSPATRRGGLNATLRRLADHTFVGNNFTQSLLGPRLPWLPRRSGEGDG